VQLYHLALSCFAFDALTHYNSALSKLRTMAALPVDLTDSKHRDALFTWLNAWRTRIPERVFKCAKLEVWYRNHGESLAPAEKCVWQLSDDDIQAAEKAYDKLRRTSGWGGGTAASKVLFAVRPEALPPWDDATRRGLRSELRDRATTVSLGEYGKFLDLCREQAQDIRSKCKQLGFDIRDLPRRLNQPEATVAMLINQYVWVSYAKKRPLPKPEEIRQWLTWSK
jgi:hypothetical protein